MINNKNDFCVYLNHNVDKYLDLIKHTRLHQQLLIKKRYYYVKLLKNLEIFECEVIKTYNLLYSNNKKKQQYFAYPVQGARNVCKCLAH